MRNLLALGLSLVARGGQDLTISRFFFEATPVNEREQSDRQHDEKNHNIIQRGSLLSGFRFSAMRSHAFGPLQAPAVT